MKRGALLTIASLAVSTPAHASWELSSGDDNCAVTGQFLDDGNSSVTLAEYAEGGFTLFVTNDNWTAVTGREYEMAFVFDDVVFRGQAEGWEYGSQKGFKIGGGDDFARSFAKAATLVVMKGDGTPVLAVKLKGSSAGMAKIAPCIASVRRAHSATLAERRALEEKRKVIAADPFMEPDAAVPIGNAGRWATGADYPAAAMREGREGVTGFRVLVGPEGHVSSCEVTATSGHADLDAETCAMVTRRARFNVAPGVPRRHFESRITWVLPQ